MIQSLVLSEHQICCRSKLTRAKDSETASRRKLVSASAANRDSIHLLGLPLRPGLHLGALAAAVSLLVTTGASLADEECISTNRQTSYCESSTLVPRCNHDHSKDLKMIFTLAEVPASTEDLLAANDAPPTTTFPPPSFTSIIPAPILSIPQLISSLDLPITQLVVSKWLMNGDRKLFLGETEKVPTKSFIWKFPRTSATGCRLPLPSHTPTSSYTVGLLPRQSASEKETVQFKGLCIEREAWGRQFWDGF
jgi:hypothetical protein